MFELNIINTPLVTAILAIAILHDHKVSVQWSVSMVNIMSVSVVSIMLTYYHNPQNSVMILFKMFFYPNAQFEDRKHT